VRTELMALQLYPGLMTCSRLGRVQRWSEKVWVEVLNVRQTSPVSASGSQTCINKDQG
jgi:hypothetical protein